MRWNIKINEDKFQVINFSQRRAPVGNHLTLKVWNIPPVKDVKYLGVIFYNTVTWKQHIYEEELKSNLNIFLLTEYVQIRLKTLRHFST
jgi:hypothetical protein